MKAVPLSEEARRPDARDTRALTTTLIGVLEALEVPDQVMKEFFVLFSMTRQNDRLTDRGAECAVWIGGREVSRCRCNEREGVEGETSFGTAHEAFDCLTALYFAIRNVVAHEIMPSDYTGGTGMSKEERARAERLAKTVRVVDGRSAGAGIH